LILFEIEKIISHVFISVGADVDNVEHILFGDFIEVVMVHVPVTLSQVYLIDVIRYWDFIV
jgi:hypothetical protein